MDVLSVLRDLSCVSGARVSLHDSEGNELYAYPGALFPFCGRIQQDFEVRRGCIRCDRASFAAVKESNRPRLYRCGCGLYEAVVPVYDYGAISGYLMLGQVRDDSVEGREGIAEKSRKMFATTQELDIYLELIPTLTEERMKCCVGLMEIVAEHLAGCGCLRAQGEETALKVQKYIHKNYAGTVSLQKIADQLGCSKSTVMNRFRQKFGVTVNAYLNQVRLEQAQKLIGETDLSFKEIAAECGFYDQNYFSKLFFRRYGCSPTAFRKALRASAPTDPSQDIAVDIS